ncbi:MAG: hypothetical protein AAF626_06350 [Pseudomonadota bacterium]
MISTPTLMGACCVAVVAALFWLSGGSRRTGLRARAARRLVRLLAWAMLFVTALNLPYFLGICVGGFEERARCAGETAGWIDSYSAFAFVMILFSLLAVPLGAALALMLEGIARFRHRNR